MRTTITILLLALALSCSAQDTPAWWPPPIEADSVRMGDTFIYGRPLANFNDPRDGAPTVLIAVRCERTGKWWRVLMRQEDYLCGTVGDTLTVSIPIP